METQWDAVIEAYDWQPLADRMAGVMLNAEIPEAVECAF